jgi:serine/threonine protein kinase
MSQVCRATDTKLKRQVAIKIIPLSLAVDHDRLAHFSPKPKSSPPLNHPHIAAIYGLEDDGGATALVMELVEGDDLAQRIARGAIALDEAAIATQITEALEAAHTRAGHHRSRSEARERRAGARAVK